MSAYLMMPMAMSPPPRSRSRARPSMEATAPGMSDFGKMSAGANSAFSRASKFARGADDAGHQHLARAGIAGVVDQRRNGPLRAAVLVLGPVMNEAEARRMDIGPIAGSQALVGRHRLPSCEDGSGNGAAGSRERQERGRVIEPMLPWAGLVPGRGRFRPDPFARAGRARGFTEDRPRPFRSVGTAAGGF